MRFTPRRSSPRLPDFSYQGGHAYHLVLNTRHRFPRFRDGRLVASCLDSLAASASACEFEILAYCFMPSHLHMLIRGTEDASLTRFVQRFKQATGHRYPDLWQRSYYDHVLRDEEALEDVARYIWGNPVRAGIVESIEDFPYSRPREMMNVSRHTSAKDRAKALSLHPDTARPGRGVRTEVPAWKL